MSRYISESLKKRVIQRANSCCEYCLMENDISFIPHQIDHIISLKHGGSTNFNNLAYACFSCNNNKGSDIGTMLLPKKIFIRLFNPRIDNWDDNFELDNGVIYAQTNIAKATIKLLKMNEIDRVIERNE
jgi:5-methylcytosine-specific restriction endonuclease McrA